MIRMHSGSNLRISNDGTDFTGPGQMSATGGRISVGGNFTNLGKVKVLEGGQFEVQKDLINSGDIIVNDPQKLKEIIIETLKTTKSVADFGSKIIEKLFGK